MRFVLIPLSHTTVIEELTRVIMFYSIFQTSWRKEINARLVEYFKLYATCLINLMIKVVHSLDSIYRFTLNHFKIALLACKI